MQTKRKLLTGMQEVEPSSCRRSDNQKKTQNLARWNLVKQQTEKVLKETLDKSIEISRGKIMHKTANLREPPHMQQVSSKELAEEDKRIISLDVG